MKRTTLQIAEILGGTLKGRADLVLEGVASLKNARPVDLSYAEEKFYPEARESRAGCILVKSGEFPGQNIILVPNPKLSFAIAAERLYEELKSETFIHPTAVVDADAVVGKGSRIGPGCTIGAGVRIGDGCVLHPRVTLYPNVEIGNNVIIHAGAVIGADGFGFVQGWRSIRKISAGGPRDHRRRRRDRRQHLHRPRIAGNHGHPARNETRQSHPDRP